MRTSFYLVLWIIIYTILRHINNSFIINYAFIEAFVIVWGITWLVNRAISGILSYERAVKTIPILDNIYTANINSFNKELSRKINGNIITTIYFLGISIVAISMFFKTEVYDWIVLIAFALFILVAISRTSCLIKSKSDLNDNCSVEQCKKIAHSVYNLDCAIYCDSSKESALTNVLQQSPKSYRIFKYCSMAIATVAIVFGLLILILGPGEIISQPFDDNSILTRFSIFNDYLESGGLSCIYILYGSFAVYFGVVDFLFYNSSPR